MSGDFELRSELDTASRLRVPSEYRDRLEALRQRFGHTVTILPDGSERVDRFNCFAFALGVWNHHAYVQRVDHDGNSAVLDSNTVQQMIEAGEPLYVAPSAAKSGDLALYFHNGRLTHAAVVTSAAGQLVLHSKWGGNEVHRHGLWEVPAMYGDCVRFTAPPALASVIERVSTSHA
jgi:hypothetical protein